MFFEADDDKNDGGETVLRTKLSSLDVRRQSMESEAEGIISELTTSDDPAVPPMGVDTPLVDQDGYPRGDVDVYRARTLRHRLATLKTDHRSIVDEIEQLLTELASMTRSKQQGQKRQKKEEEEQKKEKQQQEELAARAAPKPKPKYDKATGKWVVMNWDGTTAGIDGDDQIPFDDLESTPRITTTTVTTETATMDSSTGSDTSVAAAAATSNVGTATDAAGSTTPATASSTVGRRPFAKIDGVALDSPAMSAGLQEGDLITMFGPIHADNHQHLTAIAAFVPDVASEHGTIQIDVLRNNNKKKNSNSSNSSGNDGDQQELVSVSLQPRPWDGRGVIGCHIVPYQNDGS
eukprot:CAMPEP_0113467242 /NCGR_PEP_ID=MMETSP0014_2-20120614/14710_1 /TAXON_ID=2857 /ORGANISM="Nitzschia sp." /LENGTH=348 /DNA_ID=CAMNT_0000359537 /DNA_START=486 /DNA_END=1532 /DNA_ORIENTATION=+ /assembly_acc=CAM_ASM_000159